MAERRETKHAKKKAGDVSLPVAVIDVGTTSIRMMLAQIDSRGMHHPLEFLHQTVSLGSDTFTSGRISRANIEASVRALRSFRRVLEEYGVTDEARVRAVATTAVREASNRDAFIDRVHIATGIAVEPIDEVDVARLTYLSVRAYLEVNPRLAQSAAIVTEVGGGSTELLFIDKGNFSYSQTFHFGTLRIHEMLEAFRAPVARQKQVISNDVERTVDQIRHTVAPRQPISLIALGNDARFAASQLGCRWSKGRTARVPIGRLSGFADEMLSKSDDELVRQYHIPFADAESVGPALLFYALLGKAYGLKHVVASDISMRHGLLLEMVRRGEWTSDFSEQIVGSAVEIGRRYQTDLLHSGHVAGLCRVLFTALQDDHHLDPWWELLLRVAAHLHDIGTFVGTAGHHKHSMYLIQHCELFGLNKRDILLVSLIARYHRRGTPKSTHAGYSTLQRSDRQSVAKAAAILRVADALDRSHSGRVRDITWSREEDRFVIHVPSVADLSLEQLALQHKGTMFEDVYGMRVVLRRKTTQVEEPWPH